MTIKKVMLTIGAPLASVVLSVIAGALLLLVFGSNPIEAFGNMFEQALKPDTQVSILNRWTPLYLSGVAAAIGFRMNLFNIGVEGQYLLAALFAAAVGGWIDLPMVLHLLVIFTVAVTIGALWAGIAGGLLVTRGVNIVISTIMLNGIAITGLIAWLINEWKEDTDGVGRIGTPKLSESGQLPDLNGLIEVFGVELRETSKLTGMFLVAILVGIGYYILLNRTRFGYDLRASGMNPFAARVGGVPPKRMIMISMLLSGGVAGLIGLAEIFQKEQFPSNPQTLLGFAGIAVALLGRNNPFGIAVGAFIFAFLDSTSGVLQLMGAAPEIVKIMQAVIIFVAVISYEVANRIRAREEAASAATELAGVTA